MTEKETKTLSPQFKALEWKKYLMLRDFITSTLKTIDDCMLSVFHRSEDYDDKIIFGEMIAYRDIRQNLLENWKWTEEQLRSNWVGELLNRKVHQYLLDFDESKVDVKIPDKTQNEQTDACKPFEVKPYQCR